LNQLKIYASAKEFIYLGIKEGKTEGQLDFREYPKN